MTGPVVRFVGKTNLFISLRTRTGEADFVGYKRASVPRTGEFWAVRDDDERRFWVWNRKPIDFAPCERGSQEIVGAGIHGSEDDSEPLFRVPITVVSGGVRPGASVRLAPGTLFIGDLDRISL